MSRSYNLWNEERGTSRRAVIIINREGVVRYRQEYSPPNIPDPKDILAELDKLG